MSTLSGKQSTNPARSQPYPHQKFQIDDHVRREDVDKKWPLPESDRKATIRKARFKDGLWSYNLVLDDLNQLYMQQFVFWVPEELLHKIPGGKIATPNFRNGDHICRHNTNRYRSYPDERRGIITFAYRHERLGWLYSIKLDRKGEDGTNRWVIEPPEDLHRAPCDIHG
ncbi:MAG: hypothetical protein M1828_000221 [Chrysothrix sp. TS-e1954]|nr:MAG: hypothetical protein M1828_000221 [Chrysothrix sp. TS-e1954]